MDLYRQILLDILANEKVEVTFPNLKMPLEDMVELKCCKALRKIKRILNDETLDDKECIWQISMAIRKM